MNDTSPKSLSSLSKESKLAPINFDNGVLGKGHKMEAVQHGYVKQGECFIEAPVYQKKPCPEPCADPCADPCAPKKHVYSNGCGNWVGYLFWFVIIAIIVWFLLFSLKPDFVQKKDENGNPTGEVDHGRVLLSAIIIALIICFIIWIFQWGCGYNGYRRYY